jgi:hypothetical protein
MRVFLLSKKWPYKPHKLLCCEAQRSIICHVRCRAVHSNFVFKFQFLFWYLSIGSLYSVYEFIVVKSVKLKTWPGHFTFLMVIWQNKINLSLKYTPAIYLLYIDTSMFFLLFSSHILRSFVWEAPIGVEPTWTNHFPSTSALKICHLFKHIHHKILFRFSAFHCQWKVFILNSLNLACMNVSNGKHTPFRMIFYQWN